MRHYTLELVRRMRERNNAHQPHPFAGMFPTRVAYVGRTANRKSISYIGKPSFSQCMRFERLRWKLFYAEFDRRSVLFRGIDRDEDFLPTLYWYERLFRYYHPELEFCDEGLRRFTVKGYKPFFYRGWHYARDSARGTLRLGDNEPNV